MPQPQLGYGKPTEASIDQVNQWMRSQPWWAQIRGANTGDLSENQRRQILRAAQANGVVIDEGDIEIDQGGNLNPKGHKLRNTLIVAGLAGATLATMGAAGVFSAGAIPAASGTAMGGGMAGVGGITAAPGLAGSLSAGSLIGGAGGGASILGTAGTVAGGLGGAAAIPAAAGGTLVPTLAPGLAGSLSSGSLISSAAAPGAAGGFSWLDAARDIGGLAGDFADSRRESRNEATDNAYRENLAQEGRFRSQLAARDLSLRAPQARADNSLRGDRLANTQDLSISIPGIPDADIQGGFRPSMWSENTRQLGRQMSADALAGSGTDELVPPELARAPEPNALDSILNTTSLISAIPYRRPGRRPQPGDRDYVVPR